MKINLEILESAYIYAPKEIEDLHTKVLVPKMITRRRLTRAAKIAIYLEDKVSLSNNRIIYGSSFGELEITSKILHAINAQEPISPTHFQNSVYNTAVSYLSMLHKNENEIMTISCGDNTSLNILKSGAIKALDGDTLWLLATETLNIDKIEEANNCIDLLECGVVLKVRISDKKETINLSNMQNDKKAPPSLLHMLHIAQNMHNDRENIIKIII